MNDALQKKLAELAAPLADGKYPSVPLDVDGIMLNDRTIRALAQAVIEYRDYIQIIHQVMRTEPMYKFGCIDSTLATRLGIGERDGGET